MKKPIHKLIISLFSILILLTNNTCNYCPNRTTEEIGKQWTFMLYADEDYSPSYNRFRDFKSTVCSSDQINIVIMEDQNRYPANYWYINEGFEAELLEKLDEVNMGAQSTLEDFIKYSKEHYPAERYILGIYDHGGGWIGSCVDESNNNNWLTPKEMSDAIKSTGEIDILIMIACSMGAIEVVYQLDEIVEVFIGSENSATYDYFGNAWEDIFTYMESNSEVSNIDLGSLIIDSIWNHGSEVIDYIFYFNLTMSAINCSTIEPLVKYLDDLSILYLDNFSSFSSKLNVIMSSIKNYRNNRIDLLDLLNKLNAIETNQEIKSKLAETINAYNDIIISECHGEGVWFSNGLSIYLPLPQLEYYNSYYSSDDLGLQFVKDTHWDELIELFYQSTNQLIRYKIPDMSMFDIFE